MFMYLPANSLTR